MYDALNEYEPWKNTKMIVSKRKRSWIRRSDMAMLREMAKKKRQNRTHHEETAN